jgi:hypothetical protein
MLSNKNFEELRVTLIQTSIEHATSTQELIALASNYAPVACANCFGSVGPMQYQP